MEYKTHKIARVEQGSSAERSDLTKKHELLSVNGKRIGDAIDYAYETAGEKVRFAFRGPEGEVIETEAGNYDAFNFGIEYEDILMDAPRACRNECIFCFIDQLPKGMRAPLYFKDDDWRLSTLMGNYTTLTNISSQDMKRIKKYRVSPLYISVHSTDRDIRRRIMGSKAGNIMQQLRRLTSIGAHFHVQIVVVPGINDGEALKRTLEDLYMLCPYSESVAVVPVGLTKHREGLYPIRRLNRKEVEEIIELVHVWQRRSLIDQGKPWVFAADEMYLSYGRELPEYEDYEDFPQLENGVGMWRKLEREFCLALLDLPEIKKCRKISLCTGTMINKKMNGLLKKLTNETGVEATAYPVVNKFFGEGVTVSGLVVGKDMTEQLKRKDLGNELLIPRSMLKSGETVFLDGMSVAEAERMLGIKIRPVEVDGEALMRAALGEVEGGNDEATCSHTGKA